MSKEKYLEVQEISAYKRSYSISNFVWNIVEKWEYFERDTVGKQLVRAVDSISANISEGYYRYHKKDKVHFYYYSLGSVAECNDWIEKAFSRDLILEKQYTYLIEELNKLPREIHSLIKFTYDKLKY